MDKVDPTGFADGQVAGEEAVPKPKTYGRSGGIQSADAKTLYVAEPQNGSGGTTVATNPSESKAASGKAVATQGGSQSTGAKGNGETVNVTAADARQSIAAGLGNSIAKGLTAGANWVIAAFSDDSTPLLDTGHPFEPRSDLYGKQAETIGDGLQAVAGARALGQMGGSLVKDADAATDAISTGRTSTQTLQEQLAMQQVKSNPSGTTPPRMPQMSDTKNNLTAADGWVKRTQNVNGVEIHYVENTRTGQVTDFKFAGTK
jgi:hypothetical protein